MLEAQAVSKHFGAMKAVDRASFTVKRGEIVGLIGPNGAGKTTLFNLVAGALRPTAGVIRLGDRSIERAPAHARMAGGLGRTFQIPRPFAGMSVLANLLVAARDQPGERMLANWLAPRQVKRTEQLNIEKARALLEFVALGRLAAEPARVLSGGQRKLLELARVLMADPRIILLDEPAAGVNSALLETILTRIAEINARGITFLVIEHNMDVIARLCARVFVMVEGRILREGALREVARDPRVIEAYLGGAPQREEASAVV